MAYAFSSIFMRRLSPTAAWRALKIYAKTIHVIGRFPVFILNITSIMTVEYYIDQSHFSNLIGLNLVTPVALIFMPQACNKAARFYAFASANIGILPLCKECCPMDSILCTVHIREPKRQDAVQADSFLNRNGRAPTVACIYVCTPLNGAAISMNVKFHIPFFL